MKRIVLALTCMIGASIFTLAYSNNAGSTTGNTPASAATDIQVTTQQPVDVEALPSAVIFTLAGQYPGARIVSVYAIERNEGKLYRVILLLGNDSRMTLFVNEEGKIIKQ